jgi:hypothetical protein
MPELSGKVNVTAGLDGKGARRFVESSTVVEVTLVTIVPGAMRPDIGFSVMPTATPAVPSFLKFSLIGLAGGGGSPDNGVS